MTSPEHRKRVLAHMEEQQRKIDEAFRLSPDEIARREQHDREFAIQVERAKAKHKPWRDGARRSIEQTECQLDYDEEREFGWSVGNSKGE